MEFLGLPLPRLALYRDRIRRLNDRLKKWPVLFRYGAQKTVYIRMGILQQAKPFPGYGPRNLPDVFHS
jgi:hypothetical protein